MSSSQSPGSTSYFEQQRAELLREISLSFEQVLQNINRLNRNLESVIAVGNEFSSVEALWSQFENVMAKDGEGSGEKEHDEERAREREDSETTPKGDGSQSPGADEVKQEDDDETIR
ncbi:hypothetical protein CISG_02830 [Coccidioides immitis RMSCC 3703]|uniref:DASH complex subunit DAD1 n=3 Tax=Coccidioides TaxID=5500 RepID=A0A0J8R9Q7_COCIT|nr:hypothetical protein CPC735_059230 [Coccidioides posadasii C735 delta SOWgp]EER24553.1 hypothetical protein CPC735_059230 [Coccidioides posadasii C735 delta SOWgp]KMM66309.1 hypothetical protein CPAG_02648 [Coccidioides posadasii RMSCC 3488]KMU81814.1 hypothetical protein CISG_02830 [Coccidioides immitis RMSCC 3703]|eukprot:XP_003066698.1 hypothetical protein CPC735_059230 [Coccidioides posadasii C735 delta SOWgp]